MSEIHGAVGSYVVNALDGAELDEFEGHLAVCETCRREVVEFSETAAHLSQLVQTPPPPALRGSILSAIQQVRPLPPEMPESNVATLTRRAVVEQSATPSSGAGTDELGRRRRRGSSRLLAFALAAAMVAALGLGGWVVNLVQDRQAQVAQTTLQTQLLGAPDAKVYAKTLQSGAQVSYVVSKSLDKAMLVGPDVPAAGAGKKYQLWTLDSKGNAYPDTLFDGGQGRTAWFKNSIRQAAGLAVTIEPSSGSKRPTDPVQAITQF